MKIQWATAIYANHSLDCAVDTRWLENVKCYIFEIPPKNVSLISKDQKQEMCLRNTFQPFDIRLKPVCNGYGKFWTQKSPLENYALFFKYKIFCIFQPTLHKKLQPAAFSITTANFVEFEEKRQLSGAVHSMNPIKILIVMLNQVCNMLANKPTKMMEFSYFLNKAVCLQVASSNAKPDVLSVCADLNQWLHILLFRSFGKDRLVHILLNIPF